MAESRAAAATRARDIVLRFGVAYWVLLILPFPLNGIPYLLGRGFHWVNETPYWR